jgi:hypothetical protein
MSPLHDSAPISRRSALKAALLGAAGLALADLPLWGQTPDPRARAKAVIQIWMWGGPSHLDTFDPKPEAGNDYCGPLKSPLATNVDGVRIGELLPLLAKQADKLAIIRSMTHGVNAHETASYRVQTGHMPGGGMVHPSAGAVVSHFRGYRSGYQAMIPPYIVLSELQGRFSEAGFLGSAYKPFATGGDPNQKRFAVEGIVAEGLTDQRQRDRRELLHSLDSLGQALPGNADFAALDQTEAKAYDLILGDAGRVFDLSGEPDELRERYGRSTFGQSCLVARRLVESGVPYVTLNYKGWDTHKQHFEIMRRKLPELDKGMSTLLQDLGDRGLLDSTILWWGGEFGRTPRVQWEAPWNGGRGHYGNCFSTVLAGGGGRGGQVVGASDARGEEVAQRPVSPQDVLAAIYEQLGLDPGGTVPGPQGDPVPLLPALDAGPGKGRLAEIM